MLEQQLILVSTFQGIGAFPTPIISLLATMQNQTVAERLREQLQAIVEYQAETERLRAQYQAENAARRAENERLRAQLRAENAANRAALERERERSYAENEARRAALAKCWSTKRISLKSCRSAKPRRSWRPSFLRKKSSKTTAQNPAAVAPRARRRFGASVQMPGKKSSKTTAQKPAAVAPRRSEAYLWGWVNPGIPPHDHTWKDGDAVRIGAQSNYKGCYGQIKNHSGDRYVITNAFTAQHKPTRQYRGAPESTQRVE